MPPGELLELHQLLRIYRVRFDGDTRQDVPDFMEEVAEKYQQITGKPIKTASNPRGAGRKPLHDKDKAAEVKAVYEACGGIRETAKLTGVSTTYVYKCIKD